MANVLQYVDTSTLATAARACRACRFEAERLLYQNVFVYKVSHVRTLAKALADPSNRHRALAMRRLTVIYVATKMGKKRGIDTVNLLLDNAPNLLHLDVSICSPYALRYKWWHYLYRIKDFRIAFRAYTMSSRNRYPRRVAPDPSARVFKISEMSILKREEWTNILDTYLRSTAHLPFLTLNLNCRFPNHLVPVVQQLKSLRILEIWVPDWDVYIDDEDVLGDPRYSWSSLIAELLLLETFRLVGKWGPWLVEGEEQFANHWGQICPSLRRVAFNPHWGWERESGDTWRKRLDASPFSPRFL